MNTIFSELLGTFLLVIVVLMSTNQIYIALGFLAAILVANISGGHINPVVTMVKYIQGAITQTQGINYLIGQVLGALLAYFVYLKFDNQK